MALYSKKNVDALRLYVHVATESSGLYKLLLMCQFCLVTNCKICDSCEDNRNSP